jgi:ABC-2 type transport system ATP-binding protein
MQSVIRHAIEASSVSHRFGAIQALDSIDLAVPTGVIFGLLGPSGSGKTTLIRMIAGALRPQDGEIRALDYSMPDRSAAARIGYMTQSAALYPDLTLRENLTFFGELYGMTGHALVTRIEGIARTVDLSERLDGQLSTFSGGMVQRSSLACALLHDPDLMLLDEPTVGLDPVLRRSFWEHFRSLARQGKTLIVSSHIMDEADRCDLLGFIRAGRLLVTGTPDEIRERGSSRSLEEAFLALAGASEQNSEGA